MQKLFFVFLFTLQYVTLEARRNNFYPSLYTNHLIKNQSRISKQESVPIGNCKIVYNDICPNKDITFYLYTKSNPITPEPVRIGPTAQDSNLSATAFDPKNPVKVIIHGYNSDMFLAALAEIRKEYLLGGEYNVFFIDYPTLAQGPCYISALWNIKFVGKCGSQLIERIREFHTEDIHLIGFSLGAHVCNYVATNLRPYKLPRITGLDPAMPGFLTAGNDYKLDKSDAKFVDIFHTNAFMQGTPLESGDVDFYINGGVLQPGCWAETRFFACHHHRAPIYFAESINTQLGFWGWPCKSYFEYILGRCPPKEPQIIGGEHVNLNSSGVYLMITESVSPYAVGKYTGPAIEIIYRSEEQRKQIIDNFKIELMEFANEEGFTFDESAYKEIQFDLNSKFVDDLYPYVDIVRKK